MYIPIVVAMAAQQNVVAAVSGGPIVLIAATVSLLLCFACVALLGRFGRREPAEDAQVRARRRGDRRRPRRRRPAPVATPTPSGRRDPMLHMIEHVFVEQSLVAAFAVVGALMLVSNFAGNRLTAGRVHGSAIAIVLGLVLAYVAGALHRRQEGRRRPAGLRRHRPDGRGDAARLRHRGHRLRGRRGGGAPGRAPRRAGAGARHRDPLHRRRADGGGLRLHRRGQHHDDRRGRGDLHRRAR